jgi:hypothetical protein
VGTEGHLEPGLSLLQNMGAATGDRLKIIGDKSMCYMPWCTQKEESGAGNRQGKGIINNS